MYAKNFCAIISKETLIHYVVGNDNGNSSIIINLTIINYVRFVKSWPIYCESTARTEVSIPVPISLKKYYYAK